jgi:hypothetical protein
MAYFQDWPPGTDFPKTPMHQGLRISVTRDVDPARRPDRVPHLSRACSPPVRVRSGIYIARNEARRGSEAVYTSLRMESDPGSAHLGMESKTQAELTGTRNCTPWTWKDSVRAY